MQERGGTEQMNEVGSLVGVAALVLGIMPGRVEARVVRYEINGKVYSYETTDRQQVERARQRIEAANAADAAKARADAELVSNPLLKIVGSPAQREAAAAQARLQQLMSQPEHATRATLPAGTSSEAERQPAREASAADMKRAPSQPRAEANQTLARRGAAQTANSKVEEAKHAGEKAGAAPQTSGLTLSPAPKSRNVQGSQKPASKSVTLDLSSGIKTVQMTDGTVHEEPLDSSTVSKLGSVEPAAESLTSFVEQVRTKRSDDAASSGKLTAKGPLRN
jgi:hypothetical protein